MSDFPSKVETETSSTPGGGQGAPGGGLRGLPNISLSLDLDFLKSLSSILMLAQIALGLLTWALVASQPYWLVPAYHWVLLVDVTLWLLTMALYVLLLLGLHHNLPSVPWPLVVMVFNSVATALYLTSFLVNAATVSHWIWVAYNHMAAAAFFGVVVTLLYAASCVLSFLAWRGDGGNAASTTGPA